MSSEEGSRQINKLQPGFVLGATAESQKWAEPIVARLASEFWRLSRRLERIAESGAEDAQLKPIRDSVNRIEDVFAEHEVRAVDHEGEPYDPGLQVEVLHEREGGGALMIVETVRPTITRRGRVLQHAQVVVGPAVAGHGDQS